MPTPTPLQNLPLPTHYTIYVDGGWEYKGNKFLGVFQEQRDPTCRKGNAGIAIVPQDPHWQQEGTILLTLDNRTQIGYQPAHMELAAIIIGLALNRWPLPQQ
jgi:hypothetical protein